jgi:hypothetical protein
MTLHVFVHLRSKRAETVALLDSGATENFINISYAQKLNLPIRRLTQERRLFNIDGTPNKVGTLKYYTDIITRMGTKRTCLCYFLTDLGDNQVILGYPWFASAQPRINWAKVLQSDPLFPPSSNPSLVPPQQPQPSSPPWRHPHLTPSHVSSKPLPSLLPISLPCTSSYSLGP